MKSDLSAQFQAAYARGIWGEFKLIQADRPVTRIRFLRCRECGGVVAPVCLDCESELQTRNVRPPRGVCQIRYYSCSHCGRRYSTAETRKCNMGVTEPEKPQ